MDLLRSIVRKVFRLEQPVHLDGPLLKTLVLHQGLTLEAALSIIAGRNRRRRIAWVQGKVDG